ncbi:MAG: DUF1501 domain-containing protein [Oceanococcus sp.]
MGTKTLVVIFQRGAADGLNSIVPFADPYYYDLRPDIGIAPPGEDGGGLNLDGFYAMNPALAAIKPLYDAGELAVVQATGSRLSDRSHFSAQLRMEVGGSTISGAAGGWLGRHLDQLPSNRSVRAISLGVALDQSLAGQKTAIAVPDSARYRLATQFPEAWQQAFSSLNQSIAYEYSEAANRVFSALDLFEVARPHDIETHSDAVYPAGRFGTSMRQTAQYIKADIGIEAITMNLDGWDHHANINSALPPRLTELAEGLAALRRDLGPRFEDVVVVTMSEFGRRAAQNAALGTDHGRGNSMLVMGGAINGGQVVSDWPTLAPQALDQGDLAITIDYRQVLAEILSRAMGNTRLDEVFPDFSEFSALNLVR